MRNPAYDRVPTEHLARGTGVIVLSTETLVVLLAAWRMQPRRSRRAAAYRAKPLHRTQDHHIRRLLAVNPSTDKEKRHAQ
jgi:hypothetical protein